LRRSPQLPGCYLLSTKSWELHSPIACGVEGGKGFKVRYLLPGKGKSGGLRLGVLAICSKMVVKVAFAQERQDEPKTSDLESAFKAG
jgi:hypothetical protein